MMLGFAALVYGLNNLDPFFGFKMLCVGIGFAAGHVIPRGWVVHVPGAWWNRRNLAFSLSRGSSDRANSTRMSRPGLLRTLLL